MTTTQTKTITVKATAPDSRGTFDATLVVNPRGGDKDGERVADWIHPFPVVVPLDFQHLAEMDPASVIGEVKAMMIDGRTMVARGRLFLGKSRMATTIFERLLLPEDDPESISEMSIAYAYSPAENTTDPNGVVAIHGAELLAIAVVHAGAQETRITNVKAKGRDEIESLQRRIDAIDPASVATVNARLDAIEGADKDANLRKQLDWVDAISTSREHELHPDSEIRRLTDRLNRLSR